MSTLAATTVKEGEVMGRRERRAAKFEAGVARREEAARKKREREWASSPAGQREAARLKKLAEEQARRERLAADMRWIEYDRWKE